MSYPPTVPTLQIYAGDTFSQSFVFESDGVVRNLVAEGWTTWIAQIRTERNAATSVSFTVNSSQASIGRILLELSAATTSTLVGRFFDLQATKSGEVKTFIQGSVSIIQDVSRA